MQRKKQPQVKKAMAPTHQEQQQHMRGTITCEESSNYT
jgi:hypothetical protein